MKKIVWAALYVVLGLLSAGIVWLATSPSRGTPVELLPPPTPMPIQVHVTGEVKIPGIYELPAKSRVHDAIQAAGGFTENASDQGINLAALLEDGQQVRVYSNVPSENSDDGNESWNGNTRSPTTINALININTATQEMLETLPGIGPVTAGNIIAFREIEGFFTSIEDIQKVPGIGPVTYAELKDLITVDGP